MGIKEAYDLLKEQLEKKDDEISYLHGQIAVLMARIEQLENGN